MLSGIAKGSDGGNSTHKTNYPRPPLNAHLAMEKKILVFFVHIIFSRTCVIIHARGQLLMTYIWCQRDLPCNLGASHLHGFLIEVIILYHPDTGNPDFLQRNSSTSYPLNLR